MEKPNVICLTPVKNEAWILDRFLRCASMWADHIIIADQNSTDGSAEISKRFPKVRLIQNASDRFNEPQRNEMLLEESRRIPGPRLLISLDADEFLTSNFSESPEWQTLVDCKTGTLIRLDWANIVPGMTHCWLSEDRVFGFMDDGSEYQGPAIHSNRVPLPADAASLVLKEIKVMHYQYADWDRMRSKHRWYQCWELQQDPTLSPVSLFRQYHHMYSVHPNDLKPIPSAWFQTYAAQGIDMTSTHKDSVYWWDKEVLGFLANRGASFFSKLDIWDLDWTSLARKAEFPQPESFRDPRSAVEKVVHRVLRKTQRNDRVISVMVDMALKMLPRW